MNTKKLIAPVVATALGVKIVAGREEREEPHVDPIEQTDSRPFGIAAFVRQSTAAPSQIVSMANIWSTGVQPLPGGQGFILSPVFSSRTILSPVFSSRTT
jgi:hypothetical protein